MRQVTIHGWEHKSAHDALVELNFRGDHAISIGGRYFTVAAAELERLEVDGIQPTTWHHHEATGRIISVPGKH